MNPNLTVTHTQEYLPEGQQDLLQSGNCQKCGTGLKPGAEFCHVCGQWVFGSSFARFVNSARAVMAQTRLEVPVLVCLVVAAIFVVISLFVGSRMTPKDNRRVASHSILAHRVAPGGYRRAPVWRPV